LNKDDISQNNVPKKKESHQSLHTLASNRILH